MRGWRSKFIYTLIVFFAGFATAIYTLAPAPKDKAFRYSNRSSPQSSFDSEKFVKDFNSGMHKCLAFGKEAALRTAKLVKDKVKEMRDA